MTITTNYSGIKSIYFNQIIHDIIKLGELHKGNKNILDFGCGNKMLQKKILNNTVINYDINPIFSDFNSIDNLKFGYIVLNHVLMYLNQNEIKNLIYKIKRINSKCKFIIAIGKQNLLSKIGKIVTFNFNAHDETVSSYNEQLEIINQNMKIIKYKKNIYFMTDIFYAEII